MMRNHCPLLHMQRDISWLLLSIFPLSQPCPVLQGVAHKIETGDKKQRLFNRKALTSSSAHVCAIGEVARSDGGVKKQKNDSVKRFLHSSPTVFHSITGCCVSNGDSVFIGHEARFITAPTEAYNSIHSAASQIYRSTK